MEWTVESMMNFFREENSEQERILLDLGVSESQRFLNQLNLIELNRMKLSYQSEQLKGQIDAAMHYIG